MFCCVIGRKVLFRALLLMIGLFVVFDFLPAMERKPVCLEDSSCEDEGHLCAVLESLCLDRYDKKNLPKDFEQRLVSFFCDKFDKMLSEREEMLLEQEGLIGSLKSEVDKLQKENAEFREFFAEMDKHVKDGGSGVKKKNLELRRPLAGGRSRKGGAAKGVVNASNASRKTSTVKKRGY